jgi:hypothetical protein
MQDHEEWPKCKRDGSEFGHTLLQVTAILTFLTFAIAKFETSKISSQSEQNRNFALNFQKHWKQQRKWTKYISTEQKQRLIPRKFHEVLLVSWKFINIRNIL